MEIKVYRNLDGRSGWPKSGRSISRFLYHPFMRTTALAMRIRARENTYFGRSMPPGSAEWMPANEFAMATKVSRGEMDRLCPMLRGQRLLHRIHRRYQTVSETVTVAGQTFSFVRIADPDVVLDQVAAEEDRLDLRLRRRRLRRLIRRDIGFRRLPKIGACAWSRPREATTWASQ